MTKDGGLGDSPPVTESVLYEEEAYAPIYQAGLLLVDNSYTHRSPSTPQQMYAVPYGFDILVKPYMIL